MHRDWHEDGRDGVGDPSNLMALLLQWMDDNYNRFYHSKDKLSVCVEIAKYIVSFDVTIPRTPKMIQLKLIEDGENLVRR
jgi:hypothetical protein